MVLFKLMGNRSLLHFQHFTKTALKNAVSWILIDDITPSISCFIFYIQPFCTIISNLTINLYWCKSRLTKTWYWPQMSVNTVTWRKKKSPGILNRHSTLASARGWGEERKKEAEKEWKDFRDSNMYWNRIKISLQLKWPDLTITSFLNNA